MSGVYDLFINETEYHKIFVDGEMIVKWKRDLAWGVIFLATSLAILIYSRFVGEMNFAQGLAKTSFYIQVWGVILGLLSLALIFKSLRVRDQQETTPLFTRAAVFTIAALAFYLFALNPLGFVISTVLYLTAMILFYYFTFVVKTKGYPENSIIMGIKCLGIAVVITLIIQQLFARLLGVMLPTLGILGL